MKNRKRAFTIIELLVVVSIIALLIGILLPAIGKAREQARLTQSQSNVKQLITAHNLYGAEWKDNQWCTNDHNLARYGNNAPNAVLNYVKAPPEGTGSEHPTIWIGWAEGGLWSFTPEPAAAKGLLEPINFNTGFGYFRTMNVQSFNGYLSGRFYDPVFYAPKDRAVIDAIGTCWDAPGAFCNPAPEGAGTNTIYYTSYALSPAALFNPQVLSKNPSGGNFTDPWLLPAGLRVPTYSQARYPDLKTHILEHHWLQNARRDCNPAFLPGNYNGCEPYYFNSWIESVPVTGFYDGHVETLSVRQAKQADRRSTTDLWSRDTHFGQEGYFSADSDVYMYWAPEWDTPMQRSSFHILTVDGILGRDTFAQ